MRIRFFLLANLAALAAAAPITQDSLQPVPLLTTYGNPNSAMYLTDGLPRYAGVAQLIIESIEGVISCSGALLPSGIHIRRREVHAVHVPPPRRPHVHTCRTHRIADHCV